MVHAAGFYIQVKFAMTKISRLMPTMDSFNSTTMSCKMNIVLALLFLTPFYAHSQHLGITIPDAKAQGITIERLDSVYTSAVHSDTTLAVFRTDPEQERLLNAYQTLLQDFGAFLSTNNFKWNYPTKCWNRIYFNNDGTIDYFLYNFTTKNVKPEEQLSEEKQKEFNRLLNLFIQDYKFGVKAKVKFAQCSPTTYMPGKP